MATGWKGTVLDAARRGGLEPQLRRVQRATMGKEERRNALDDEHLDLAIAFSLPVDAVCVDVGANLGTVLETLTRLAPEGRHFAFEPLPELAADLRRRFPQVEVRESALADRPGTATFHRAVGAHSRSSLRADVLEGQAVETFEVKVEVLDDVIPEDVQVDFLKIDVEGAQLGVLQGATRILGRDRPTVVLEHGGPSDDDETVFGLLADAGLRIFDMDGGGPYDLAGFRAELSADDRRWNWLAHR